MMVGSLITSLREVNLNLDKKRHMSCVVHVINLIVQEGLKYMEIPKAFTIEQMTNLVDDNKLLMLPTISTSIGDIVSRVRQLIDVIYLFTQRRKQYVKFCKELCMLDNDLLLLNLPTQWNSTHDMMIGAYEKRQVLNNMTLLVLFDSKNYCTIDEE